MDQHERFKDTLERMIAGELEVEWGHNEFIGHTDVVRQLLEVATSSNCLTTSVCPMNSLCPHSTSSSPAIIRSRVSLKRSC